MRPFFCAMKKASTNHKGHEGARRSFSYILRAPLCPLWLIVFGFSMENEAVSDQKPKAKSQKPRAKSQEPKAKSQKPKATMAILSQLTEDIFEVVKSGPTDNPLR